VGVAHDGELPTIILDAGTGLQRMARVFNGEVFQGSILLGHLHWDHTHGIPFFPAGDRPDARVDLWLPAQEGGSKVLEVLFAPPHFPITPAELRGAWTVGCLEEGTHKMEGFEVLAREIPHKGGRTFGYRVSDGASSVAYLSDHSPVTLGPGEHGDGEIHEAALDLCRDVDLMIHDAQYTEADFEGPRKHFGHSTIAYAVRLAEQAKAGKLLLFHHDSTRTDDAIDALVAGVRSGDHQVPIDAAVEGAVIDLP
jgi:ribonuclease BN (tRNA processing enzyme)